MGKQTEKPLPFYSPDEEELLVLPLTEDRIWEAALLLPLNLF